MELEWETLLSMGRRDLRELSSYRINRVGLDSERSLRSKAAQVIPPHTLRRLYTHLVHCPDEAGADHYRPPIIDRSEGLLGERPET
jgi:hypothetical protein